MLGHHTKTQVIVTQPRPEARLRLICFPNAGATDAIFAGWAESLSADIEVGAMRKTGAVDEYEELIPLLTTSILEYISTEPTRPFALFGHSLGSMLAFGVARRLQQLGGPQPLSLLVASANAPQLERSEALPNPKAWTIEDLALYLRAQGGTAEGTLQNPARMNRLLAKMQVDLALRSSFRYEDGAPYPYPIALFTGQQDQSVGSELLAWETQTSAQFTLYRFPGNHFFLHEPQIRATFLQALQSELYRWLERSHPPLLSLSERENRRDN